MRDLALSFGSDLEFTADGDLALATGYTLTEQRILRRLLTNQGDYIWQTIYGAGLAQFVGQPSVSTVIEGVISAQLRNEPRVATIPVPQAKVIVDQGGTTSLKLNYSDNISKTTNAFLAYIG